MGGHRGHSLRGGAATAGAFAYQSSGRAQGRQRGGAEQGEERRRHTVRWGDSEGAETVVSGGVASSIDFSGSHR
jgi:hypothetical protein